jgi:hypothetical protein
VVVVLPLPLPPPPPPPLLLPVVAVFAMHAAGVHLLLLPQTILQ